MISFYSNESSGATLYNTSENTIRDTQSTDFNVVDNDSAKTSYLYQYGYGKEPKSAEDLESYASKFSTFNPAVADGVNKIYDTSKSINNIVDEKNPSLGFTNMMNRIRANLNIPNPGVDFKSQLKTMSERYNRFKLPNVDMEIKKGFAHVFFCKPLCHLLDSSGKILTSVAAGSSYADIFDQSPMLVKEIAGSVSAGYTYGSDDFMYILSNYAKSFSLSDEELRSDTYGRTYTGYKISYGKTNIESKTAGSFSVTFSDDKILSVYKIHRLWLDYINDVYRGRLDPESYSIMNKVLDYVGSVYYILTAEDNETVLFWSKYYGVYPTSIPSTQYSWNAGSFVNPENITIQYNYSWKEDFNPEALVEFNTNARLSNKGWGSTGDIRYAPKFKEELNTMGDPIVRTPYIERVTGDNHYTNKFIYKLRYLPVQHS